MRSTPAVLCAVAVAIATAGCQDSPDQAVKPPVPPPLTSIKTATGLPSTPSDPDVPAVPLPQQAVASWQADHSEVFTNLTASMAGLVDAIKAENLSALQQACAKLDTDADPLSAALPSPDPALTTTLQSMANDVESAVKLCGQFTMSGASTADVQQFTSLMADAQKQFDAANRLMADASG